MSRRRFTEREVLSVLVGYQHVELPCFRCGKPITLTDIENGNCEREHLHELALGGPDEPSNCRYSHRAAPCHHTVTNGPPATTAGSSKNRAAKANNENRRAKFVVQKLPVDQERPDRGKFGRRPFSRGSDR